MIPSLFLVYVCGGDGIVNRGTGATALERGARRNEGFDSFPFSTLQQWGGLKLGML